MAALAVVTSVGLAWGISAIVSVKLLLDRLGSKKPEGDTTVAVLARLPVAEGLMARVNWKLVASPLARVPVVKLTLLVPLL